MATQDQPKKPGTFDELTHELDKNALSPEVVAAESQSDTYDPLVDDTPPDPRGVSPNAVRPRPVKVPEPDPIDENDVKEAATAADNDVEASEGAPLPLDTNRLRLESDPSKPRPHFWRRKRFWFSLIFLLILGLALAWFIRPSRLFIVNSLGLRGEVKVTTTTLPEEGQQSAVLKKVTIEINSAPWETDDHGLMTAKLPYADTKIVAKKAGYETVERQVMVDFDPFFYLMGGRQHDETERDMKLQLKAVGLPVKFQVKDWLTGDPIAAGAFSVGEVVAKPDGQGLVHITIPATDEKVIKVKALFGGKFQDKEFDIKLDGSQPIITFTPLGKTYFMSNKNGGLGVYASNIDGQNVTEIVAPSPIETAAMNIAISPNGKYGILASTRDGKRDAQGTLQQQLYVVDLSNKKLTPVDQGQWFAFADWAGDTLVYTVGERTAAGQTQRISSIDATNNKRTDITNGVASFGAVRVAFGNVLYQVNALAGSPSAGNNPEQRVASVKGEHQKSIGTKVQQLSQVDPERFVFQTGDGAWQEYNANKGQIKPSSAPGTTSRVYLSATTADGQNRVAIDRVDGKPAIIARSSAGGQEKTLYTAAGIKGPFRIVDDVIIFRVADGTQTADYAMSIRGGTPKKMSDVTASVPAIAPSQSYISLY